MATPNYSFEKRKREQAKKAAKEAKRLRKETKTTEPDTTGAVEEAASDALSDPPIPVAEG